MVVSLSLTSLRHIERGYCGGFVVSYFITAHRAWILWWFRCLLLHYGTSSVDIVVVSLSLTSLRHIEHGYCGGFVVSYFITAHQAWILWWFRCLLLHYVTSSMDIVVVSLSLTSLRHIERGYCGGFVVSYFITAHRAWILWWFRCLLLHYGTSSMDIVVVSLSLTSLRHIERGYCGGFVVSYFITAHRAWILWWFRCLLLHYGTSSVDIVVVSLSLTPLRHIERGYCGGFVVSYFITAHRAWILWWFRCLLLHYGTSSVDIVVVSLSLTSLRHIEHGYCGGFVVSYFITAHRAWILWWFRCLLLHYVTSSMDIVVVSLSLTPLRHIERGYCGGFVVSYFITAHRAWILWWFRCLLLHYGTSSVDIVVVSLSLTSLRHIERGYCGGFVVSYSITAHRAWILWWFRCLLLHYGTSSVDIVVVSLSLTSLRHIEHGYCGGFVVSYSITAHRAWILWWFRCLLLHCGTSSMDIVVVSLSLTSLRHIEHGYCGGFVVSYFITAHRAWILWWFRCLLLHYGTSSVDIVVVSLSLTPLRHIDHGYCGGFVVSYFITAHRAWILWWFRCLLLHYGTSIMDIVVVSLSLTSLRHIERGYCGGFVVSYFITAHRAWILWWFRCLLLHYGTSSVDIVVVSLSLTSLRHIEHGYCGGFVVSYFITAHRAWILWWFRCLLLHYGTSSMDIVVVSLSLTSLRHIERGYCGGFVVSYFITAHRAWILWWFRCLLLHYGTSSVDIVVVSLSLTSLRHIEHGYCGGFVVSYSITAHRAWILWWFRCLLLHYGTSSVDIVVVSLSLTSLRHIERGYCGGFVVSYFITAHRAWILWWFRCLLLHYGTSGVDIVVVSVSLTPLRHIEHGYCGGFGESGPGLSSISPLRTMIHSNRVL